MPQAECYVEYLGLISSQSCDILQRFFAQNWEEPLTTKAGQWKEQGASALDNLKDLERGINDVGIGEFLAVPDVTHALTTRQRFTWEMIRGGVSETLFLAYIKSLYENQPRTDILPRNQLIRQMQRVRQEQRAGTQLARCSLPDAIVIKSSHSRFEVQPNVYQFCSSNSIDNYSQKRLEIDDTFSSHQKKRLVADAIRRYKHTPGRDVYFPTSAQISHELVIPSMRLSEVPLEKIFSIFDMAHPVEVPSLRRVTFFAFNQFMNSFAVTERKAR